MYAFRLLFGRRHILSDVEGHGRQRVAREWYFANWLARGFLPAHALAEAAAAQAIDVERQLVEGPQPPPRALPVRLFKSLFRTAKSFFPPTTSGDGSTNENNSCIPPQPQIPTAHRHISATTPKELGILQVQSFEFKPRRSRLSTLRRKFATTPKDGGKIGIHYAGYTPKSVRRYRKSTHKTAKCIFLSKFCSRLLRAVENGSTTPNSTISRHDKGKAPEARIPGQSKIPTAHTRKHKSNDSAKSARRPRKSTCGHKPATTPQDGGTIGIHYSGYTSKPVRRSRSTYRRSKSAKINCIFLESKLVSRLFRDVKNGSTPATSLDELTRENTRRNTGKAPEHRHPPPGQFPEPRTHRHGHRSATATKDNGKNATHDAAKTVRRPGKLTYGSTKSTCRFRKSARRRRDKSAITPKDGSNIGIHYAGYTPKPVRRSKESTHGSKHAITKDDVKTHKSEEQKHHDVDITPPPKAHTVRTSSSKQVEIDPTAPPAASSSRHSPNVAAPPTALIRFAPDPIYSPHPIARKPLSSVASFSVLDLSHHYAIPRKSVPSPSIY